MATESKELLTKLMSAAVNGLSDPQSYEQVYHRPHLNEEMLSLKAIKEVMQIVREVLFPGYFDNTAVSPDTIKFHLGVNIDKLYKLLVTQIRRGYCFSCVKDTCDDCDNCKFNAESVSARFIEKLPEIREKLAKDVKAMYLYDPASKGYGEIIFAYPAIKAITINNIVNLSIW